MGAVQTHHMALRRAVLVSLWRKLPVLRFNVYVNKDLPRSFGVIGIPRLIVVAVVVTYIKPFDLSSPDLSYPYHPTLERSTRSIPAVTG